MIRFKIAILNDDGSVKCCKLVTANEASHDQWGKRGPLEYQTMLKAAELYRDAFWMRPE